MTILSIAVFLRIECAKWKHCWGISQAGHSNKFASAFCLQVSGMWHVVQIIVCINQAYNLHKPHQVIFIVWCVFSVYMRLVYLYSPSAM